MPTSIYPPATKSSPYQLSLTYASAGPVVQGGIKIGASFTVGFTENKILVAQPAYYDSENNSVKWPWKITSRDNKITTYNNETTTLNYSGGEISRLYILIIAEDSNDSVEEVSMETADVLP